MASKLIHNGKRIAEILSARKYYGRHATGRVVLVSGFPYFHGTVKEANKFYKDLS